MKHLCQLPDIFLLISLLNCQEYQCIVQYLAKVLQYLNKRGYIARPYDEYYEFLQFPSLLEDVLMILEIDQSIGVLQHLISS